MKRTILLGPDRDQAFIQAQYLDAVAKWLYPDVALLGADGAVLWQTNRFGLRGADVEPGQRIGVVWGDSVVFGLYSRTWSEMLNDYSTDCIFLNGGVEGATYVDVLRRAVDFNRRERVAVNVIMPGWLEIGSNEHFERDLRDALSEIPNAVLVTMPTSLNAGMIHQDITSAFVAPAGDAESGFNFWGTDDYSVHVQKILYGHLAQRNALIRGVAAHAGIPLIDLFVALDSTSLPDFRTYFMDVSHPRPSAYAKIAALVWEGARSVLETAN